MVLDTSADPTRRARLAPWREHRAKALIREDLGAARTVGDIAKACDLSPAYFAKAFKTTTGVTPHQWLQSERMRKARRLLLARTPLAQVAAACGFVDQSHFGKAFKRQSGLSPRAWTRLHAEPDVLSAPAEN